MANEKGKKTRKINYNNWGYFFIAPFFVVFVIFQLIPLITTIGNSFFENYRVFQKFNVFLVDNICKIQQKEVILHT